METKTLINLTRNTIRVYDPEGVDVLFELPTDTPTAEAEAFTTQLDEFIDDESGEVVEVVRHEFDLPRNVPDPEEGTVYVVSYAVLQALGESRPDVVAPDTGKESAVRDGGGRIIGVRRFRGL